ncbi:hypothetical protein V6C32_05200 [Desulforamulus ruminis]|uniref:hypothetical protein n=1 Tax=Desulforamulus ruminis TaxID=1564 RepID=UPI002FDAAE16
MSEERLERMENLLLDLVKMVGANNTAVKDLKGDMDGVKSEVAGLKTEVAGLKLDVTELKSDVSVLKTDVAELKTDVTELKTDVTGLKLDVAELKSDVSALKRDVSELKIDVRELIRNQEIFREELFTQSARLDEYFKDLSEKLSDVALNANYAVSMVVKHDKEIFAIKERLSL